MADGNARIPIIDSHIHLYAAAHLPRLNWTSTLPDGHILNQQRSVEEFKIATKHNKELCGFIFLETDRKSTLDPQGWKDSLDELEFLVRIARGQPIEGEGHTPADQNLLLGIVPWAPIAAGPDALERYVAAARQICIDSDTFSLVKGFRYLVQDKPRGTMLQPPFLSGLQWLGRNGFVFDLGVDARSGGLWQLQEACDMLQHIYSEGSDLTVVINHCCKPNLRVHARDENEDTVEFANWATHIREMGKFPNTFMKLSGFFSELPAQQEDSPVPISQLLEQIKPWVDLVLEAFTPSRILFGSDWPVCTANGPGGRSWQHWHDLVAATLEAADLNKAQQMRIWSGTATQAYKINSLVFSTPKG